MRFRLLALAVLSLLTSSGVLAQNAAPPAELPEAGGDELFQKMDTTVTPGCAPSRSNTSTRLAPCEPAKNRGPVLEKPADSDDRIGGQFQLGSDRSVKT
jgi:hypothetical protein